MGQAVIPLDEARSCLSLELLARTRRKSSKSGFWMERLEIQDPDAARMGRYANTSAASLWKRSPKETGLTLKQVRLRWERGMKRLKRALLTSSKPIPSH